MKKKKEPKPATSAIDAASSDADLSDARDRILAAAEELFLRSGFTGVSVDRIASRVGMSKKTIYRHFESRREIEFAAVDRFTGRIDARLRTSEATARGLRGAFTGFFAVLAEELGAVNLAAVDDLEFRDPELWQRINTRREALIRDHLGRVVREGQVAGEVRDDLSVEFIVGVMVALILSFATPSRLMKIEGGATAFTHDVAALLLDGIGAHHEH